MIFYTLLFIVSGFLLHWSSSIAIKSIKSIASYLGWREFAIAFFGIAIASSFPNLFLGISSALHGIPELSFADALGNNVVDLTLAVALAVFIAGSIRSDSRMIQTSSLWTIGVALLPLLLIADKTLSREDGVALLLLFCVYSAWLFHKRKGYKDHAEPNHTPPLMRFGEFAKALSLLFLGAFLLPISAEGLVRSISFLADSLHIPLTFIGILVIGFVNALPDISLAITSARKGETWFILGGLMGSVIVLSTLVLGMVAFIHPITINDFSPFAIARLFLILSAVLFFLFARTDRKITKKEALFLLFLYAAFVAAEVFLKILCNPASTLCMKN